MRKLLNLTYFIAILLFSVASWGVTTANNNAQSLDGIVAIVNDEIITQSQLNEAMDLAKREVAQKNISITDAELRERVLDQLILIDLQVKVANRAGLTVDQSDIDKAIANIAKQNNLTISQFKEELSREGIDFKEFQDNLRKQLLIARVQQEAVAGTVQVTDQDIESFKKEYAAEQKANMEYELETIVIPYPEQGSDVKSQADVKQLLLALQRGKSLDVVAKEIYGENNSVKKEELGWRSRNQLPTIFENIAPHMRVGGYAGPVEAPNGFHILHLLRTRSQGKQLTSDEIREFAFQKKFQEAVGKWVKELRDSSYVKIME